MTPPDDPSRRRFVRTVAGTTIAAALPLSGCGHFAAAIPDSANAAWESMRLLRVGAKEIERHRDGISITSPFLVAVERLGLFDRSAPPAPDSSILRGRIEDFDAQDLLGRPGETVQMLCRVGYLPPGESMPAASPRRGLDAHLAARR